MQLLQRLSLFPVVFAAPQELQSKLPADYALACVQCMAMTQALAQAARSQGTLSEVSLEADTWGTHGNETDLTFGQLQACFGEETLFLFTADCFPLIFASGWC